MELQYISTEEQVADILTKALGKGKFVFFRYKGVLKLIKKKVPRQVFLIT